MIERGGECDGVETAGPSEVDRALRRIAVERGALDVEEARWLRVANDIKIWLAFSCASLLEYVERRLGYGPRAAQERLRVALALESLPELEHALAQGEIPFSGIRELTRVATPETEPLWLHAGAGKSVHEIENLVSGHRRGDRPDEPTDPELVLKVMRYEVRPSTKALLREAKRALEKQRGGRLDDDSFLEALANLALTVPAHAEEPARSTPTLADDARQSPASEVAISRARYQVAITICATCKRGWSDAGASNAPLDAAELARVQCDAQHLGRVDADAPTRAYQDVTPAVRRQVHRRDRGKCAVPGCRSSAYLEIHHIVAREHGGSHAPKNLILLCDGHHSALHDGTLTIRGEAPDHLEIHQRRDPDSAHVGVTRLDRATSRVQAKSALTSLGFKPCEAAAAIDAAIAQLGTDVALDQLIRAALSHCPRPS